MTRALTWLALAAASWLLVAAPAALAEEKAATATARIGADIRYLASDELEGRGVGTQGIEKAAEYIRAEFKRLGLAGAGPEGEYFQRFPVTTGVDVNQERTQLVFKRREEKFTLEMGEQFQPLAVGGSGSAASELVFAGYGISAPDLKYDDFAGVDVKGKIIVVIRREPQQNLEQSAFDGKKVTRHSYILTKLQQAKKQGAAGLLLVNDGPSAKKQDALAPPLAFGFRGQGVPFAHVRRSVVDKLLAAAPLQTDTGPQLDSLEAIEAHLDKTLQPVTQPLDGWTAELGVAFSPQRESVANVAAVLPGIGDLANQTVVVGAHYDHLGFGGFGSRKPNVKAVHNGADDNASGTAALLELARRFAETEQNPRRRLLFIAFGAEERGLIGSNYYVENPWVPLDETVAMINFDMVGRVTDGKLIVMGVGTAKQLEQIVAAGAAGSPLKIDPVASVMGSSDHFGFYQKGVPALHFFTGLTDEYHTPEDDFETLNVEGINEVVAVGERVIERLAVMRDRPDYVKLAAQSPSRGNMPYLGITPSYGGDVAGVKVTAVAPESPAALGGLQGGDVIVEFAEIPVADITNLAQGLRKSKPGEKVKVVVQRGEGKKTLEVTLGEPRPRR